MQTAAELRDEARHARELANNTFDSQLKKALLTAAEDFEEQAVWIEHGGNSTIQIGPEPGS